MLPTEILKKCNYTELSINYEILKIGVEQDNKEAEEKDRDLRSRIGE